MNVSELFSLTQWINKEIERAQIPQKYHNLQSVLQNNCQPNRNFQPFETQKNDLINFLNAVPLNQLTRDQIALLEQLGIAQAIGEKGIATIEDILYKNVLDIATAAQKISQMLSNMQNGISKSNQIKSGLTGVIKEEEYEVEDEILMRVSFIGNAQMTNVTDFKKWGGIWYDIGRGIAMAHNSSPENIKIVGATKGSIVIELAVIASIATTASQIILAAFKVAEKIIEIKQKLEELKALKIGNEILEHLKAEIEKQKSEGIEEITESTIKELKLDKNSEGDKIKALDTSIKNLVNFTENGGIVDFIVPENVKNSQEGGEQNNLISNSQQIRQLQNKLLLIEHKKS
jgi:hypothetical protein